MKKKRASLLAAERSMENLLKRVGYTGKYKGISVNEIPNYKITSSLPPTSDKICSSGNKKQTNIYTGTELLGIGTMHKSNAVPIRKDSNDAIDIATMRRN